MFVDEGGLVHGFYVAWSGFVAHCGHMRDRPATRYDGRMLTCVACFAWTLSP